MKKWILIFTILLLNLNLTVARENQMMQENEILLYEVDFLGISLGYIKIVTEEQTDYKGKPVYKTWAYMKSYDGIPFVHLNAKFESWIDPTVSYSHHFEGNVRFISDDWTHQNISFDYDNEKIYIKKYIKKKLVYYDSIKTSLKCNDGLSLYYLARQYLNLKRSVKIPTIIDKDTVFTTVNFLGKKEDVEVDAVDYPIKTVYFNGYADWEGIYGMKGKFEGWFSDDEAKVPIKAKMNVLVGSVNIELKKWKRKNWKPPKAD